MTPREFYWEWAHRVFWSAFGWARAAAFVATIIVGALAHLHIGRDLSGWLWLISILLLGGALLYRFFTVPYLMYHEVVRDRDALKSALETSQKVNPARELGEEYAAFARGFRVEWAAERETAPYQFEHAQEILSSVRRQLLQFRSNRAVVEDTELSKALDEITTTIGLLAQQCFAIGDGGKALRDFWDAGTKVVTRTEEITALFPQ